jgi:hypothetical protein
MLDILFSQDIERVVPAPGDPALTSEYLKTWFEYNFTKIAREQGLLRHLMYVCIAIVDWSNFQSLSLHGKNGSVEGKGGVVKNFVWIFSGLSPLHIGFFTDQRKG